MMLVGGKGVKNSSYRGSSCLGRSILGCLLLPVRSLRLEGHVTVLSILRGVWLSLEDPVLEEDFRPGMSGGWFVHFLATVGRQEDSLQGKGNTALRPSVVCCWVCHGCSFFVFVNALMHLVIERL